LPVASIPPSPPPEQLEETSVSIFEVFTGSLGGGEVLAIRLVRCAARINAAGTAGLINAAGTTDIFAVVCATATAAVGRSIPLIFAVGPDEAILEPST